MILRFLDHLNKHVSHGLAVVLLVAATPGLLLLTAIGCEVFKGE